MPRIPDTDYSIPSNSMLSSLRPKKLGRVIMKSHSVQVAKNYHLPLRIRPWFILFSSLVMLILALFGFTDVADSLPLNDKVLHFLCLGFATGVLYWVFDVEEEARRVWLWRYSPMIITGVVCIFFGGIVSEFVQAMLPSKHFQVGDVIANLAGSAVGLTISYYLERYYRHRREISRLYRPINATNDAAGSDDDEDSTLLPIAHGRSKSLGGGIRLGNVWDEEDDDALRTGHEIFAIGDDDDLSARMTPAPGSAWAGPGLGPVPKTAPAKGAPRIIVTAPSTASLPRTSGDVQ